MTETEKRYRELKAAHDKRHLKIEAYRHRLKKEIDPAAEEWDTEYQELARLEAEHEAGLLPLCFARLEYEQQKTGDYLK